MTVRISCPRSFKREAGEIPARTRHRDVEKRFIQATEDFFGKANRFDEAQPGDLPDTRGFAPVTSVGLCFRIFHLHIPGT